MFEKSAHLYDTIYRSFKDYKSEAEKIAELINRLRPNAKTILDVACGTGEHALYLKNQFELDGLDLNNEFLELARSKNPKGKYFCVDMIRFDLGRKYDVVMCLFSSIGYVKELSKVKNTLQSFIAHLNKGGIIIVEGWLTPEQWKTGRPHMVTIDEPELKVSRMNICELRGKNSYFKFHYLVAQTQGVQYFTEEHELGLFSSEEMIGCFKEVDLSVEHDPVGIFDRSLYVAQLI